MNGGHKAWLIHVPGRLNACPTNAGRSRCPAVSRIKEAKGAKNACTSERTTSHRARRLAARGGIRRERRNPFEGEHKELMAIYVARGLDPTLAKKVAAQLMAHDALGAHARDELGISTALKARPIQAALASAASFVAGAALPLVVTAIAPVAVVIPIVSGSSLLFLALLGGL